MSQQLNYERDIALEILDPLGWKFTIPDYRDPHLDKFVKGESSITVHEAYDIIINARHEGIDTAFQDVIDFCEEQQKTP